MECFGAVGCGGAEGDWRHGGGRDREDAVGVHPPVRGGCVVYVGDDSINQSIRRWLTFLCLVHKQSPSPTPTAPTSPPPSSQWPRTFTGTLNTLLNSTPFSHCPCHAFVWDASPEEFPYLDALQDPSRAGPDPVVVLCRVRSDGRHWRVPERPLRGLTYPAGEHIVTRRWWSVRMSIHKPARSTERSTSAHTLHSFNKIRPAFSSGPSSPS